MYEFETRDSRAQSVVNADLSAALEAIKGYSRAIRPAPALEQQMLGLDRTHHAGREVYLYSLELKYTALDRITQVVIGFAGTQVFFSGTGGGIQAGSATVWGTGWTNGRLEGFVGSPLSFHLGFFPSTLRINVMLGGHDLIGTFSCGGLDNPFLGMLAGQGQLYYV